MINTPKARPRNGRATSNILKHWLSPFAAVLALGMTGTALAQTPGISVAEDVSVGESAGKAEVELTLSAESASEVSVRVYTSAAEESAATAGSDYYGYPR